MSSGRRSLNSNQSESSSKLISLADILSSKSNSKKPLKSSNNISKLVPSLEDLQKKLDGSHDSNSKLNFSRALNLTSADIEPFSFEENGLDHSNNIDVNNPMNEVNDKLLLNNKNFKQNRRKDSCKQEEKPSSMSAFSQQSLNDDAHREITQIIGRIEKGKFSSFDNDFKTNKLNPPDFNSVQLPKNFNLDFGKVNVYRSGIIEIISGDNPPKIHRCKPLVHKNNITTDLVISTDTLAYIDRMNICTPTEKS